jgi:hypothetical protein
MMKSTVCRWAETHCLGNRIHYLRTAFDEKQFFEAFHPVLQFSLHRYIKEGGLYFISRSDCHR